MSDEEPFYSPTLKPPPPRQPKPGELLFEFYREHDHQFFRCELRDHGPYGVEAQFFDPVDLVIAHLFQDVNDGQRNIPARELAIAWAEQERKAIKAYRG